jgi:hypothetical protein
MIDVSLRTKGIARYFARHGEHAYIFLRALSQGMRERNVARGFES